LGKRSAEALAFGVDVWLAAPLARLSSLAVERPSVLGWAELSGRASAARLETLSAICASKWTRRTKTFATRTIKPTKMHVTKTMETAFAAQDLVLR